MSMTRSSRISTSCALLLLAACIVSVVAWRVAGSWHPSSATGFEGSGTLASRRSSQVRDPEDVATGTAGARVVAMSEEVQASRQDRTPAEMQSVWCEIVLADGRSAGGAAVWYVDETCIPRRGLQTAKDSPELLSMNDRLKAIGKFGFADAEGRIELRVVGRNLGVRVESAEMSATESFDIDAYGGGVLRVVLSSGDTLRLRLSDPGGVAISGAPLLIGPLQSAGGLDPAWSAQIGVTDTEGVLVVPGWQRLRSDLRTRAQLGVLAVGVGYIGGAAATVVVPDLPPDHLSLVAPRPVRVSVEVHDAAGEPLLWRGQVLRFWDDATDIEGASIVAVEGRADLIAVPERLYRWSYGTGAGVRPAVVLGTGIVRVSIRERLSVRCDAVVSATGRLVGAGQPSFNSGADPLRVQFNSDVRKRQNIELPVDSEGRFRLQLARGDRGPLLFTQGEHGVSVPLPAFDGPLVDLGIVAFGAVPYAEISLTDESGALLMDSTVSVAGEFREQVALRQMEPGHYQLVATASADRASRVIHAVALDCSAKDRLRRILDLERDSKKVVVLPRINDLSVGVKLAALPQASQVWVRLLSRWEPREARWVIVDHWAPCVAGVDGLAMAIFPRLASGRYTAVVMSSMPPSVLVEAEVELEPEKATILDAMGSRVVLLDIRLPTGSVCDCYVAAGATVDAWDRVPLGMAPVAAGRVECIVRSDEHYLLVVGTGVQGAKVPIPGANAAVTMLEWSTAKSAGIEGTRLVRPLGAAFHAERSWQIYSPDGPQMQRDILSRDDLLGGPCGWLLPTDYEAVDQDNVGVLIKWSVDGSWRVVR